MRTSFIHYGESESPNRPLRVFAKTANYHCDNSMNEVDPSCWQLAPERALRMQPMHVVQTDVVTDALFNSSIVVVLTTAALFS